MQLASIGLKLQVARRSGEPPMGNQLHELLVEQLASIFTTSDVVDVQGKRLEPGWMALASKPPCGPSSLIARL